MFYLICGVEILLYIESFIYDIKVEEARLLGKDGKRQKESVNVKYDQVQDIHTCMKNVLPGVVAHVFNSCTQGAEDLWVGG